MKTISEPRKGDILLNLFEEVGSMMKLDDVYAATGIKNLNSLRSWCSHIRHHPGVPEESRIDIRIQDDICIRVN